MNEFESIFEYVNKRQELIKSLNQLLHKQEKLQNKLIDLDKDFKSCNIDVQLYKKFFQNYCILFADGSKYVIKDIVLFQNNTEKFYEAVYDYYDGNNKSYNNKNQRLSLRKILHILNETNAKLVKNC